MTEPTPSPRPYHTVTRPPRQRITFDEYLAFADAHEEPFEYIGGFVYAKGVPSATHTLVAGNIYGHLWTAARRTGCRAYMERGELKIGPDVFLPDVFVACEPPLEDGRDAEPCLVVEVLSPGTAITDRTTKRVAYTSLASVQAYWIVSQEWRSVERHWRGPGADWQLEVVTGDGALDVPCPPRGALTLDEIYEGLDVPSQPPPPRRVREPWPEPATA